MAERPDNPVELPGGRLVCRRHRRVVCGHCTVDYSFMQPLDESGSAHHDFDITSEYLEAFLDFIRDRSDEGDTTHDASDVTFDGQETTMASHSHRLKIFDSRWPKGSSLKLSVGTGSAIPAKFDASKEARPETLFRSAQRFMRRGFSPGYQFLVYAGGACLENGGSTPKAGCSFIYKPAVRGRACGYASFPLEASGPTGEVHLPSSNRAELRAVIGALRFRPWHEESCKSLVIATDSEYVVEGITTRVKKWTKNGWKTNTRAPVKNQGLWRCLLGEMERCDEHGLGIQFWRIPREWNTDAHRYAKEAALRDAPGEFVDTQLFFE
jgi:ribonuclease HI